MISSPQSDEPPNNDEFIAAVSHDDELGAVIRGHLYVESALDDVIQKSLVNAEALRKVELTYAERVYLSIALGLTPEAGPPLLALGTLRNKFAHQLDARITKSRMDALRSAFSPEHRTLLHDAFLSTKRQTGLDSRIRSLKDLSPRDQFTLIVIALRNMLLAAGTQV